METGGLAVDPASWSRTVVCEWPFATASGVTLAALSNCRSSRPLTLRGDRSFDAGFDRVVAWVWPFLGCGSMMSGIRMRPVEIRAGRPAGRGRRDGERDGFLASSRAHKPFAGGVPKRVICEIDSAMADVGAVSR